MRWSPIGGAMAVLIGVAAGGTVPRIPAEPKVVKLAGGFKFVEGPVWLDGAFVFSDNQNDTEWKWTAAGGAVEFRKPSAAANGHTVDRQGRLIICAQHHRAIERRETDGSITSLVDNIDGKGFNSPNDVVVKSDDTIWFTDPPYDVPKDGKPHVDQKAVYRFDPKTKKVAAVVTDMDMPNGLAFSPDEKILYISDTGKPHHIRAFDVRDDGTLAGGRVFCVVKPGVPDGFRVDGAGRIWTSAGDGIHLYDTDGKLVGKIPVPESPANLCFGGDDGKTLFITARKSIYSVRLE